MRSNHLTAQGETDKTFGASSKVSKSSETMAFQYPLQLEADLTKTPSDVTLLGRTSSEVVVMFVVDLHYIFVSSFHFCIFILLLSFICRCFFILLLFFSLLFDVIPHPSVDYCRGFYTPFYTFSPAHHRVMIRDTFIFRPFRSSSCRRRYGLEWAFFYPQAFFTLRFFADILTCVYQGFPGGRQFFLEVCRASY